MAFGLTNALVMFMDSMSKIFESFHDRLVIIFIDDILVFLVSEEEHTDHLRTILEVLR